jgi:choline kinase
MTITRAVILSAGKGSRLYPHTEDKPKCLLPLAGRTLLEWQLDALHAAGVEEMTVVTGFHHQLVDAVIARRGQDRGWVEALFNPFYQVADNTGSVWIARERFDRDLLLLNGDTLISPDLAKAVVTGAAAPINVTIDRKSGYDADDMKVATDGAGALQRIGKQLTVCDAESIGFLAFRGDGPRTFADAVQRVMETPEGTRVWYLSVIDALAQGGTPVGTVSIEGQEWQEVDYPADLDAAAALTERWAARGY